MKLKHTLMLAALGVALNGIFVANAADEKPAKDAKAGIAQPAARKAARHDHAEPNKKGETLITHDDCCRDPAKVGKKSAHDHGKEHK